MAKEIIRPACIKASPNTFCPGCLHSMAIKLISETLEELGLVDKTILTIAVGCGTMSMNVFNLDMISAAHGRAPAVATGIKRSEPDSIVFTYQGDGDLAAIGLSEIMCAANRGEKFTVVFINNSTYGMTGGQLAPTTLIGQKSTTTPLGRQVYPDGYPMDMCKLLSTLQAPSYIARCSLSSPANVRKAKEAIKKAFQYQVDGKAFSFVELLSNCVTNWNMTPLDSLKHIDEVTSKVFPLGVFRDIDKGV